jgi:hypothetical protein
MSLRDQEKERYKTIKNILFSEAAREPGLYHGIPRSFCLGERCSAENLFAGFREEALEYFRSRNIPWHDGLPDAYGNPKGLPSNHLCCSQSACVNALFPFVRHPELIEAVFSQFYPDLEHAMPFYEDDPLPDGVIPYLAFEWIGKKGSKYLCEKGNRLRGANATSADFAFRFRRKDGHIQLVLGEWKYTEYYARKEPDKNETRHTAYKEAFDRWNSVQPLLPDYDRFFVEPFYQLMRLTLLAQEMEHKRTERDGEMEANIVSVLLIAPNANNEYKYRFTSQTFSQFGKTVSEAWTKLATPERFQSFGTERFFEAIREFVLADLEDWKKYLMTRYGW